MEKLVSLAKRIQNLSMLGDGFGHDARVEVQTVEMEVWVKPLKYVMEKHIATCPCEDIVERGVRLHEFVCAIAGGVHPIELAAKGCLRVVVGAHVRLRPLHLRCRIGQLELTQFLLLRYFAGFQFLDLLLGGLDLLGGGKLLCDELTIVLQEVPCGG